MIQSAPKTFFLSVSFYKNQAKWEKSCKAPLLWQYSFIQRCFLYLKRPFFDLCITGFAQIFFNRMLEKWGIWQRYLSLKCSFPLHFNEIITQYTEMVWKNSCLFSLILMVQIVQLNFQNGVVFFHTMFHPLPDSYRLTLKQLVNWTTCIM